MKIAVLAAFTGEEIEGDAERTLSPQQLEEALPVRLRSNATRAVTWMHGREMNGDPHAQLIDWGINENAAIQGAMQILPNVTHLHEYENCQMPPARITLPDTFRGTLLWGGVAQVTSTGWLRYEDVRVVVNCLSQYKAGQPNLLW